MHIVVHGATGAQGRPVALALGVDGHQVVGLTRSVHPGNADFVSADINDPSSLIRAYARAEGVFIHLPIPSDPHDAGRWVPAILQALQQSTVRRVVLSTSGAPIGDAGPHPIMQGRRDGMRSFVNALQSVVAEVVVIAPRLFLENLLLPFVTGPLLERGVLRYPLPATAKVSWISHRDVAEAVRQGFEPTTAPGIYNVGLPAVSGNELAAAVGDGLNRKVTYEAITPAEFGELATPLLGESMALGVAALYDAFQDDHTLAITPTDPQLVLPDPLTASKWSAQIFR